MSADKPQISIVICSHRRFEYLKLAVQSLCEQTSAKESFEVLVVDNDPYPNDEVIEIVEKASGKVNIYYIQEPTLGLSQARNTGVNNAKSEYVGYIDDDAKAPRDYIRKCIEIIDYRKPDIFGGPFYAYYLTNKPVWFKDIYGSYSNNGFHGYFSSSQFVNGSNMCFRKSLFKGSVWFDPDLGMVGKNFWYGEETMLQMKAWLSNPDLKVWYDKNLFVEHLVYADKMKVPDKFRRAYFIGKSQAYLWVNEENIPQVRKKAPYRLFKTIIFFFIRGLGGLINRDKTKFPYWQNYAFEVLSPYFSSIGQEWRFTIDLLKKGK